MTESACMTHVPVTKLLPKTLDQYRVMSAMWYTVTANENGIQNPGSIDRVTFAPYKA